MASIGVPSDAEPEGDWLTDSTRPIIHAIAPRAAAELALRIAEETDARVAELPLDRMAPLDPESPISSREHLVALLPLQDGSLDPAHVLAANEDTLGGVGLHGEQ